MQLRGPDRSELINLGRMRPLPKGYQLFQEGRPKPFVAILLDTRADAIRGMATTHYDAGDLVGELSFVDGMPHAETVTLVDGGQVLCLNHEAFDQAVRNRPRVGFALVRSLARRVRKALVALDGQGDPALARVTRHLAATGTDGYRGSQEALARELGLSRSSVTRAITVLRNAGTIRTERGRIHIIDPPDLRLSGSYEPEKSMPGPPSLQFNAVIPHDPEESD